MSKWIGNLSGMNIPEKPKKKEVYMRRVLVALFLGFLFLAFASYNSYAEMGGGKGQTGESMRMMGEMRHHGMGMMEPEHRMWRALKGLGLDEKQREAIKDIKSRVMKDSIRKRTDVRIAIIELKYILDKDPVDMNAAEAKLKQIESMKTDMHLSHIKTIEEVKAQLTQEQKKKFKENLRRHGRWIHDGKGKTSHREKKGAMQRSSEHTQQ